MAVFGLYFDNEEELTEEQKQYAEETFVNIARQHTEYNDIKDRIRGLHSYNEITDAQYNYILDEWDNMLKKHNL